MIGVLVSITALEPRLSPAITFTVVLPSRFRVEMIISVSGLWTIGGGAGEGEETPILAIHIFILCVCVCVREREREREGERERREGERERGEKERGVVVCVSEGKGLNCVVNTDCVRLQEKGNRGVSGIKREKERVREREKRFLIGGLT